MKDPLDSPSESFNLKGLFEGELILYTFSCHLVALDCVPSLYEPPPNVAPPAGALILSIQAVDCTLQAWSMGKFVMPKGAKGHFSKDNWNDTTKMVNGKEKKSTSTWGKTTRQWVEKKKKTGLSCSSSIMVKLESDKYFVLKADVQSSSPT
ncbi:hypothetical protein B0H11DRAFT_2227348 [Mycena galericulata]|nr:hypothetical protein B0H11DRAFT_2227348 [Mycena galericulata]